MPPSVQAHLSAYRESSQPLLYSFDAFSHLLANGIRPGTNSSDMELPYDCLGWDLPITTDSPIFTPLQGTHSDAVPLLWSLGGHFLKRLITALLSPNGHFPALLLSTMWGLQCGHTSLCVQGIFGSGKTYCASPLLVITCTVLRLPCVLTSEPNLPSVTAAETISDLLRDAPSETQRAYGRVLAQNVPKLTPIDVLPVDRSKLFQPDFTPGNFLQLAFPTGERFPFKKASHFAVALYILSISGHKGPVGEELPTEQRDAAGPTYVSAITGILLPFLLRPELRPGHVATSPEAALFQLGLPLFPRDGDQCRLSNCSFYMPISSIRDLSRRLLQVPSTGSPTPWDGPLWTARAGREVQIASSSKRRFVGVNRRILIALRGAEVQRADKS